MWDIHTKFHHSVIHKLSLKTELQHSFTDIHKNIYVTVGKRYSSGSTMRSLDSLR